jgi:hypothetical protein
MISGFAGDLPAALLLAGALLCGPEKARQAGSWRRLSGLDNPAAYTRILWPADDRKLHSPLSRSER